MAIYSFDGIVPSIDPTAFVHPDAVIIGDVHIGPGASIWPNVTIRGDVNKIRIGAQTNVQDGSVLHVSRPTEKNPEGTPLIIGDRVTIAHSVTLHACRIEEGCMIGMSSTVMDRVVVGAFCLVAAGSLVPPGKVMTERSLWMGWPAKFKRTMDQKQIDGVLATNANYVQLAKKHQAGLDVL
ncbi:MAG: gamma carbonic anhydrase family protein [Magnetococcales bacterium]|nr:gamma carbonic anhydrase family protein [Magnetococcales bacterium]